MSGGGDFGNPLRKFKLVFLGEQSGELSVPAFIFSFFLSFSVYVYNACVYMCMSKIVCMCVYPEALECVCKYWSGDMYGCMRMSRNANVFWSVFL